MIMTEWQYVALAQQYEQNLDQIRQQLFHSILEQRRLNSMQAISQYQLSQAQSPLQSAFNAVVTAKADEIFAAKAKEQKICQEIYGKLLQQLNNNLSYHAIAKHSDRSSVTQTEGSTVFGGANSAFVQWTTMKYSLESGDASGKPTLLNFSPLSTSVDESAQLSPAISVSGSSSTTLPVSPSTSTSGSLSDVLGEMEDSDALENRPYRCTICNKRFRFKSNLFEHKSLHIKTQSFLCPFCGKTCRLKGNLKKHLQVHVNTMEDLEKLWKNRFSRSSGRPRKDTPPKPLPALGDDLGLVPINKSKQFFATWIFSDEMPTQ